MKKLIFTVLLCSFYASSSNAKISYDNEIVELAISSAATSESHFVTWKNKLEDPTDCLSQAFVRTRFSREDNGLLSLFLFAKASGEKLNFYYETTPITGSVPGHKTTCQITNAWISE